MWPILYKKEYKISQKNVDFDYVLDPLIRAKCLVEFLSLDDFEESEQKEDEQSSTFYIIHPLLKHLTIINHNKTK